MSVFAWIWNRDTIYPDRVTTNKYQKVHNIDSSYSYFFIYIYISELINKV